MPLRWIQLARRFLKYNMVGVLGVALRLSVTALLHEVAELGYLLATSLAVEITMLHNFSWHLHWTWRDTCIDIGRREIALRLLRFQLSNGALAMIVNWLVMPILVGKIGMNVLFASVLTITATGVVNFLVANFLIFQMAARGGSRSRST
jgi:putative flippase GtrA